LNTKVNGAEIKGDKVTLDLETKKGDKETLDADVVLVCAGSFLSCAGVMQHPIQAMPSLHQQHTVNTDLRY
jgi:L-2-hydroxyglutarate oxidase LhgO